LCIFDSKHEWRLLDYDHEEDEFLFGGYPNQKAEGDSKENRTSLLGHLKACH